MNINNCFWFNAAALLLCTTTLSSCGNDTDEMLYSAHESSVLSDEILEKISYGCDDYLYADNSNEKVEFSASEEYMNLVRDRLLLSHTNKSAVVADDFTQYLGVIKSKDGCGKFDQVKIYYDCEDGSNNHTYSSGYTGVWTHEQNINMWFCLVPATLFFNNDLRYGVMNFTSAKHYYEVSNGKLGRDALSFNELRVHMDAEDRGTATKMYFIKYGEKEIEKPHIGNVSVDGNGNLNFGILVSEMRSDYTSDSFMFPYLGFEYGVFGSIYNKSKENLDECYGRVHSDDEDKNNANSMYFNENKKESYKNKHYYDDIIRVGDNTDFYISQIPLSLQRM